MVFKVFLKSVDQRYRIESSIWGKKYLTSCLRGGQGWVEIGTKVAVEIWCKIECNESSLYGQFFSPILYCP